MEILCVMEVEFITKEDLQEFRKQLIAAIQELLGSVQPAPAKPWLKHTEVLELLGMSPNTLQRLRIAGKLRSTKVGGVHYYRYADIAALMNGEGDGTG
jgi:hypothetical protein